MDLDNKIKELNDLSQIIDNLKSNGTKIVHCHGVFDLLHPGHIRHFEAAKREGDTLVVTVTRDEYVNKGPGRPVFNHRLRAESIAALSCVDFVAINDTPDAVEAIKKLKPHIYCKGSDYANRKDDLTGKIYDEEEAVKSVGGQLHLTNEPSFSSTKILNLHYDVYPEEARKYLEEFRRKYSSEEIIGRMENLKDMKVLVIGDAIIDQYHYIGTMGKSPKDNIIVTKFIEEENFAGGALAAANHVAGFCKNVRLVTCLGMQDSHEEFIRSHLQPNIETEFFYREDAPTVVKRRFVEPTFLTKMFGVSYFNDHDLPEPIIQDVNRYLAANTKDYDLVLVTDFGHGLIDRSMVNKLCEKARFLAVNTQTNTANAGYNLITKYQRADYICIDEPETRLACHDKFGNLDELMVNIAQSLNCDRMAVTHGHFDTLSYSREEGFFMTPIFSKEVKDTVGAGDAFLAVTSPCTAAGFPMDLVGFIGNAVGALKVRIVCNRTPVEPTSLYKFIKALLT